jgi:hypothetical protein
MADMNAIEFVIEVRKMRLAQITFFGRGRKKSDLILAKQLEGSVDKALDEGMTVYATSTLEEMDGVPAEGEQLGMFEEPDAGDLLDLSGK